MVHIKNRSIPMVIILSIVTCGIYYLIWIYQTSDEINQQLGDTQDSAGLELLFTIISCGFYGIYWYYKYSKKLCRFATEVGAPAEDNSVVCTILSAANYFVGVTIYVAQGILQNQINFLANGLTGNTNQPVQPSLNNNPYTYQQAEQQARQAAPQNNMPTQTQEPAAEEPQAEVIETVDAEIVDPTNEEKPQE